MAFGVHDHPFYRPLWRRVAIVAVTGVMAAVELLWTRDGCWTVLFGGVFIYSVWAFLINWKDRPPPLA